MTVSLLLIFLSARINCHIMCWIEYKYLTIMQQLCIVLNMELQILQAENVEHLCSINLLTILTMLRYLQKLFVNMIHGNGQRMETNCRIISMHYYTYMAEISLQIFLQADYRKQNSQKLICLLQKKHFSQQRQNYKKNEY